MATVSTDVIGKDYNDGRDNSVNNARLIEVNKAIRIHPVEKIGETLRGYMTDMKAIIE